jgi:hypothetical protein
MAATLRISYFGANASEPAGASASGGFKFNTEDTQSGTAAVSRPLSTGTNFSWIKQLATEVTATAATAISNRKAYLSGAPTTGLLLHFKQAASYVQAASGNQPSASGSNGATPAGYTALSTTPQTYDSGSDAASGAGRSGDFCVLVAGVSNNYAGGAGNAIALPDFKIDYDEA